MERKNNEFDAVILGGGPAGLSAALWCAELGLRSIVLEENDRPGGQLHWIHTPIRNYPGVESNNGADFLKKLLDQVRNREFQILTDAIVGEVNVEKKRVSLSDGHEFHGASLIVATGIRRRKLGVDGEEEFAGKGILETGQTNRDQLSGKRVAIIGGGDAAFENAAALSSYAERVYLLHRRHGFSARQSFVDRASGNPRVEIITDAAVKRFAGKERLESVEYADGEGSRSLLIDAALIRIGVEPNTRLFRDSLQLDERGYIIVDNLSEASVSGVFAIGDVANPISPTLASAAGMAATALKTLRSRLK